MIYREVAFYKLRCCGLLHSIKASPMGPISTSAFHCSLHPPTAAKKSILNMNILYHDQLEHLAIHVSIYRYE